MSAYISVSFVSDHFQEWDHYEMFFKPIQIFSLKFNVLNEIL